MQLNPKKVFPALIILLAGIGGLAFYNYSITTTVLLVRHAEKVDDAANANLSEEGLTRADALVKTVDMYEIAGIYSTNFCRTALTVSPVATAQDLPIYVQQISSSGGLDSCAPAIQVSTVELPSHYNDLGLFVDLLLANHKGQNVLIAGHSNTTPALVNALGKGAFDEPQIEHDAYGDLYIITFNGLSATPTLSKAKFGS